ncbi:MAG: acyl-CoA thioesterase [Planctomycetia bacterium]|nr:acyl-CoA thioesterase [Planctomycetia bacterium]
MGQPLRTSRRVEFRDTDAAGIVHFSAFFPWMEAAEHELLRRAGVQVVERNADGAIYSWPRVSASCDYKSALRFADEFQIEVAVAEVGRTSVTYGFHFTHDGVTVARGRIVAVRCLMHPGGRPEAVLVPPTIIALLEPFRSASSPAAS